MAKKFFVVIAGRKPGVYTSWLDAAPHVIGVTGAIFAGYDSETEAFRAYGKAGMAGERLVLGANDPDETPSQSTSRVRESQRRHQAVSADNRVKTEIKGDESVEEIVVQCPPVVGSRSSSTIQRTSTLPTQHTPRSPTHKVQRSKTSPDLDSRPMPSTPKKNIHGQKPQVSKVGRPRAISICTSGSTTEEESIPPSPATNVSITLSPTFDHLPLSPPHETTPCRSSPARRGGKGDRNQHSHQSSTAPRSARGSRNKRHGIAASPCRKSGNATGDSTCNAPRQGTSRPHQSSKKSQPRGRPLTQGGPHCTKSRISRDRSRSCTPPSPEGSSHLTYTSDDERPEGGLTRSTSNSDYYTPFSGNSEVSDAESEDLERAPSYTLKRKGKYRASPPPSPFPCSSSPSSPAGSSSRDPNSGNIPTPKKRRDRYTRPPGPSNCGNHQETPGQTLGQDPSQSLAQDFCHCAGPCPSCNMPRFPFPPYYHPLMFQSIPYQHLYLPPPHMHTGYPLPHYGPPLYPYPHMISQPIEPLPSISSAQPTSPFPRYPMPHPLATHPPTAHPPDAPSHVSLVPFPTASTPAPEPSAPAPVPPPPVSVGSPLVDPPAPQPTSSEIFGALGQFTQPPQRSVMIIDPLCDPRSPYAKQAVVPAFPNNSIILGRPGTPGLSPLEGLALALSSSPVG